MCCFVQPQCRCVCGVWKRFFAALVFFGVSRDKCRCVCFSCGILAQLCLLLWAAVALEPLSRRGSSLGCPRGVVGVVLGRMALPKGRFSLAACNTLALLFLRRHRSWSALHHGNDFSAQANPPAASLSYEKDLLRRRGPQTTRGGQKQPSAACSTYWPLEARRGRADARARCRGPQRPGGLARATAASLGPPAEPPQLAGTARGRRLPDCSHTAALRAPTHAAARP